MKLFDVYPLFDVNIVKGRGCKVWDDKGQEYLDLYGGHAVISIGHSHPHYINKVTEQLGKIGFYSNSVINKLQAELAERLGKFSGYDDYQLFLINSGAEANENALKLASFKNPQATRILSCEHSFHGRTSLAVEVTNNPKIVAPLNDNHHVRFLPLNDIEPWVREMSRGGVAAVILECIQGVGGIQMATPKFAQDLAYACKRFGVTLICDEIQCGYGRSSSPTNGSASSPTSLPLRKESPTVSPWAPYSSRPTSSPSTDSWAQRSAATIWLALQPSPCSMCSNRNTSSKMPTKQANTLLHN